jgi:CBS domain-containing protein
VKVSEVMTHDVISISPEANIRDALTLMLKNHISGLPVIDDKTRLVGMISEGDFLHRSEIGTERKKSPWYDAFFGSAQAASTYVQSHGLKVRNVMTEKVITITANARLDKAVDLMERNRIKRLPVINGRKVIGIVSRANLVRALAVIQQKGFKTSKSDGAIRKQIRSELNKHTWSAGLRVDIIVHNGIVDLWGAAGRLERRDALQVLAKSVPGVKSVRDHISFDSLRLI